MQGSDIVFGKVGMTDKGDYTPGTTYNYLEAVAYNDGYWISKENGNTTAPSASNEKWHLALQNNPSASEADVRAIVTNYEYPD